MACQCIQQYPGPEPSEKDLPTRPRMCGKIIDGYVYPCPLDSCDRTGSCTSGLEQPRMRVVTDNNALIIPAAVGLVAFVSLVLIFTSNR